MLHSQFLIPPIFPPRMICPHPRSQSGFHRLHSQSLKRILKSANSDPHAHLYTNKNKIRKIYFSFHLSVCVSTCTLNCFDYMAFLVLCTVMCAKASIQVHQQAESQNEDEGGNSGTTWTSVFRDSYHSHVNVNIICLCLCLKQSIYFYIDFVY